MDHQYVRDDIYNSHDEEDNLCEAETIGTDELLIELIKGYPHLYNSSLKDYKNIQMKDNSWREIGKIMNKSAAECQNRWVRLRERFAKETRLMEQETRSGSGASHRQKFHLYQRMLYLKNYIKRRKSYSNVAKQSSSTSVVRNSSDSLIPIHLEDSRVPNIKFNNLPYFVKDKVHKDIDSEMSFNNNQESTQQKNRQCSPLLLNELESLSGDATSSQASSTLTLSPISHMLSSNKSMDCSNRTKNINLYSQIPLQYSKESTQQKSRQSSPLLLNESESLSSDATFLKESPAPTSRPTPSPVSHMSSSTNMNRSKKMKTNNNNFLEHTLVSLSETLQKRAQNNEPSMAYNLNDLSNERTFDIFVGTELERIPEPEKSKRKKMITEILWKPW